MHLRKWKEKYAARTQGSFYFDLVTLYFMWYISYPWFCPWWYLDKVAESFACKSFGGWWSLSLTSVRHCMMRKTCPEALAVFTDTSYTYHTYAHTNSIFALSLVKLIIAHMCVILRQPGWWEKEMRKKIRPYQQDWPEAHSCHPLR